MPILTLVQAVNDALKTAMRRDPSVRRPGRGRGPKGGVFLATEGLTAEFGVGALLRHTAFRGRHRRLRHRHGRQRPQARWPRSSSRTSSSRPSTRSSAEAAKLRYRSGGQYTSPLVIRTPYGGGIRGGLYHSQSGEAYFCHTPGLKVVVPSTPADAKGLLLASIDDPDPVLFLEPKALYRTVKEEVPEGHYTVNLSTLRSVRDGKDCVIFCYGAMVPVALKAAEQAAEIGHDVRVVDLRTLLPLDEEGVLEHAKQTGRVVVLHEAPRFCGFGAEISAMIAEHAIEYMDAPVVRVAGFDTPFPNTLEHHYLPDARRALDAVERVMAY
jgi:pyruvate dehydrogenase E1 component beta subunit